MLVVGSYEPSAVPNNGSTEANLLIDGLNRATAVPSLDGASCLWDASYRGKSQS